MRARLALLVVPLVLSGCGSSSSSSSAPSTSPEPSAGAEAAWNPCGGLDPAPVQKLLGEQVTKEVGTPDVPRCALVPQEDGGAVIDASYLVFDAGLDAAWDQMGAPDDGSVTEPDIPGADAARLVADPGAEVLGVTGFLQNGSLIQVVNLADTAPYDTKAAVRAVTQVLSQLSAYAGAGGAPQ